MQKILKENIDVLDAGLNGTNNPGAIMEIVKFFNIYGTEKQAKRKYDRARKAINREWFDPSVFGG